MTEEGQSNSTTGGRTGTGSVVGLACAGGGMEGALYEIGVLCALQESIEGIHFEKLDVYVGVSAGALISACLANGIPPRTLSESIISRAEDPLLNIEPEVLFAPAWRSFLRRFTLLPAIVKRAVVKFYERPFDQSVLGTVARLGELLPLGLFDNTPLQQKLAAMFSTGGRTDDFEALPARLRVVAVNLDSSEVVLFGDPDGPKASISKAVQASSALPILYGPVEIDGQFYIDGVARRTVHASVALEAGVDLLFCINPIVYADFHDGTAGSKSLVDRGLPAVLSQTFRMLVYSRMKTGFRNYRHMHSEADLILIEPSPKDFAWIFSNIFSFANRFAVGEHSYQTTRQFLRDNAPDIQEKLGRHRLTLKTEVLHDESRTLYGDLKAGPPGSPVFNRANHVLERLDHALQELQPRLNVEENRALSADRIN